MRAVFRVPTFLAPSPISGVGVFTPFPIRAGTILWEFTPGVDLRFPPSLLESVPEPFLTQLRHHCYEDDDGMLVLCGDHARFMNHSFEPNCDDSGAEFTVARRDIAAGEELTCDYRLFDAPSARTGLAEWQPALGALGTGKTNGRRRVSRGRAG